MPTNSDEAMLELVVREQRPRLVAMLTLRTGSVTVAEELAQDALVDLVARWRDVEDPGAWLTRVAMNRSASWWRRRSAERRALQRHGPDPTDQPAPAVAEAMALHDELAKLPDKQQQVLILRWFVGLDVAETARVLGIAEGSVKSSTHRALKRLRVTGQLEETANGY